MAYQQKHGVNIGRWLCHGDDPLEEREKWLVQDDLQKIRDMGLDHVRLCLKEKYFWAEDGTLNPRAIEILRRGIDWALDAGLVANVNLHILRSHNFLDLQEPELFTSPSAQTHFVKMWTDLSDNLHDYSTDKLAFEFMNEPVARANERWNTVWRQAYDALRAKEKERVLILGSNLWNQSRTFKDLTVPENDPNMMLDFHFYEPILVSHYNAPWTPITMVPFKLHYPGRPFHMPPWLFGLYAQFKSGLSSINRKDAWRENVPFTKEIMASRFQLALDVAKKHNLPLNLGEFGVYSQVPQEIGKKWLHDVFSLCQEMNISWTIWTLGKGDDGFAIMDKAGNPRWQVDVMRPFLK
jgi:endoglucanase